AGGPAEAAQGSAHAAHLNRLLQAEDRDTLSLRAKSPLSDKDLQRIPLDDPAADARSLYDSQGDSNLLDRFFDVQGSSSQTPHHAASSSLGELLPTRSEADVLAPHLAAALDSSSSEEAVSMDLARTSGLE